MEHTKTEIVAIFQQAGIPCAPLNTTEDLVGDPQLAERGYFVQIDHPAAGRLMYPGAPFRMEQSPFEVRRPAPTLGQHNAEVLGELGYDTGDLAALSAAGVI
jgi:crotonobetainyl-CoA:carnitine CoA-transferase CaiB-like acyl-CoA transferase